MKSSVSSSFWNQNLRKGLFFIPVLIGMFCLIFIAINTVNAAVSEPPILTLKAGQSDYLLGNYIEYLEDPGGTLSIEQVSSPEYATSWVTTPGNAEVLNFGLTKSTYWLRFHIRNEAPAEVKWRLELARPTMNTVILFRPEAIGNRYIAKKTGYIYPFATREIPHELFVFDLPVAPGTDLMLYMSVKDKSMQLPLRIWETSAMQQRDLTISLLAGLSLGGLIIMIVYNFFMTIILRELSFVYYVLFQVSLLIFFGNYQAYFQHYLWPRQTAVNNFIIPLMIELTLICMTLFVGAFFQIRQQTRGWRWFYNAILVIWILCALVTPTIQADILDVVFPLVFVTVVYIFLLAFWTWVHGFKPARFYMISWTVFLFIAAGNVLERMGLFSVEQGISDLSLQFAAVYVVAFQSLALADRFNLYKLKMLDTQTALLAKQQEAMTLKDDLARSLEISRNELEQKISERTQALHQLNLELSSEVEIRILAQREAEILARTDPLTGLYNRRYFSQLVEYEFSKARRYNHSLSILILDIDYFKQVNDTFGHQVGDQALVHLAKIFKLQSRETDILARYGGEEFVALLPETSLIEAQAAAERLRSIIQDTSLEVDGKQVCMTVSIGVAAILADGQNNNFDDLLKHADEALYQAKNAGRNRVIAFSI